MDWGLCGRRALRMALAAVLLAGFLGCGGDGDNLVADIEAPPEPPTPTPRIEVTPTALVLPLPPAPATSVTVENVGAADLLVGTVVLTGADAQHFGITRDDCSGTTVAVSGACTVAIAFLEDPATQVRSAVLTIPSNDPTHPVSQVEVTGGPFPLVSPSRAALSFGAVAVGAASAPQTVQFTNTGNVDVTGISVATTGSGFSIDTDGCSGSPLAPDQSCDVAVVFQPTAGGAQSGGLAVTSNAPTVTVALSGTGEVGAFSVDLAVVDFGDVVVGGSSTSTTVTVTNNQAAALTLTVPPLGGDDAAQFAIVSQPCTAASVPALGSCSVEVSFSPTSAGPKAATLVIQGEGETVTVPLAGRGLGVAIQVSPPQTHDFGDVSLGATATFAFTVSSVGTADLQIDAITIDAADYALGAGDTCSNQVLVPGANCTLEVSFSPTEVGTLPGTVTIPTNIAGEPQVTLSLTGSGLASVALAPATHAFGGVDLGASAVQTFTFSNAGPVAVTVGAISVTGASAAAFSVPAATNTCSGATVPAAGSCSFAVRFAPTTEGGKFATVAVPSDDPFFPELTAELTGTGLALTPLGEITPAAFSFGNQGVGLVSSPVTFAIRNTGLGSLILGAGSVGSDFGIQQDLCSAHTLPPGGSCTVQAVFAPAAFGAKNSQLSFPSNDPTKTGPNNPIVAPLTGFGIPALTATPRTLGFGSIALGLSSESSLVTVSNLGPTASPVGEVKVTGASFLLFADACSGVVLAPAGTCTLEARFQPTTLGTQSGKIDIPSASGNIDITLSGVAIAPVSVNPLAADFGDVAVGATATDGPFTLTNVSGTRVSVGQILAAGAFAVNSDSCSNRILAPAETCTFDTVFAPVAAGPAATTVRIPVNGIATAVEVPLSGFGI